MPQSPPTYVTHNICMPLSKQIHNLYCYILYCFSLTKYVFFSSYLNYFSLDIEVLFSISIKTKSGCFFLKNKNKKIKQSHKRLKQKIFFQHNKLILFHLSSFINANIQKLMNLSHIFYFWRLIVEFSSFGDQFVNILHIQE